MLLLRRPYLLIKHIKYNMEILLDSNFVTIKEQND